MSRRYGLRLESKYPLVDHGKIMLAALLGIVDALVTLGSLGFLTSDFRPQLLFSEWFMSTWNNR